MGGIVAFNHPIVLGDTGVYKGSSLDSFFQDIASGIDVQFFLQGGVGCWELQDTVIKRGP